MAPDACWKVEPDVLPGNETAWSLYKLFDTKWDWGAAGYRTKYDVMPAMYIAEKKGATGDELEELCERLKIIETAVFEIETDRYHASEARRERERKFNTPQNAPQNNDAVISR